MDAVDPLIFLLLALAGVAAGASAGLFGIGGGIITVPAVVLLTSLTFREAVSISLLAMLVTTPLGLWSHAAAGNVRWRLGLSLGAAGLVGVLAATVVDPWLNETLLSWLFAGFLLFASHRLAYGSGPLLELGTVPRILVTGFVAGLAAKLLGIGGGLVIVPTLVFAGSTIHVAVATSLVGVELNALSSTVINLVRSPRGWPAFAVPVIVGAWVGIWGGSRLGIATHTYALQRSFAVFLAIVSFTMVRESFA